MTSANSMNPISRISDIILTGATYAGRAVDQDRTGRLQPADPRKH